MYEPYLDDRRTSGLLRMTDTLGFKNIMKSLDDEGIQLAVHAIGDRANDWIIDEYINLIKINGNKDRRSRIEHAQHLTIEAINKIGNYNIIPSMQPYGCIDDSRWMHKRIGPSLMSRTYIFNTFLDKNVNLTFGSDWEVTPLNPLEGIYAAVTRQTLDGSNPNGWFNDQRISVENAIMCYTKNNAFAGFQEDKLGTIEKGKYADFVVLSDDITKIEPINIPKTIVVRTVVGGRDVFTLNN
jgi:predicted amidohydrolase YtcJ